MKLQRDYDVWFRFNKKKQRKRQKCQRLKQTVNEETFRKSVQTGDDIFFCQLVGPEDLK